jgi:hypothetical protein
MKRTFLLSAGILFFYVVLFSALFDAVGAREAQPSPGLVISATVHVVPWSQEGFGEAAGFRDRTSPTGSALVPTGESSFVVQSTSPTIPFTIPVVAVWGDAYVDSVRVPGLSGCAPWKTITSSVTLQVVDASPEYGTERVLAELTTTAKPGWQHLHLDYGPTDDSLWKMSIRYVVGVVSQDVEFPKRIAGQCAFVVRHVVARSRITGMGNGTMDGFWMPASDLPPPIAAARADVKFADAGQRVAWWRTSWGHDECLDHYGEQSPTCSPGPGARN